MAQVPFRPTEEQRRLVENLSGIGCTVEEIRHCIPWGTFTGKPISEPTLRKHFRAELDRGRSRADMRLKQKAYEMAMGGNTAMVIFLTKVRLGWRETMHVEQTGPAGQPLAPAAILYLPEKDPAPDGYSVPPQATETETRNHQRSMVPGFPLARPESRQ